MGWGTSPELAELLDGLQHPGLKTIDLSLNRMHQLLQALGNPEQNLPPVIHVAGTNGKGSLVAYLRGMFEVVRQVSHVYTSPHLIRFHERIVVADTPVADNQLTGALMRVKTLQCDFPATFFEATTAAALLLFARNHADVCLLEVGLGGRLDATNVVANPAITAITPISIDHAEFLGETITAIAAEKAGIMKVGVPCVVGPQAPQVMAVLEARAKELNVPLFRFGHEWHLRRMGEQWEYGCGDNRMILPAPALVGPHQWANAATAVACLDAAKQFDRPLPKITPAQMKEGIKQAYWPGRLQRIYHSNWLNTLPKGSEIWLDGGHNPAAAAILANWASERTDPLHMICGMLSGKDAKQFIERLASLTASFHAVPIEGENHCIAPEELAKLAVSSGIPKVRGADNVDAAIISLAKMTKARPVRVLITGSLYLAGSVLQQGLDI